MPCRCSSTRGMCRSSMSRIRGCRARAPMISHAACAATGIPARTVTMGDTAKAPGAALLEKAKMLGADLSHQGWLYAEPVARDDLRQRDERDPGRGRPAGAHGALNQKQRVIACVRGQPTRAPRCRRAAGIAYAALIDSKEMEWDSADKLVQLGLRGSRKPLHAIPLPAFRFDPDDFGLVQPGPS